MLAKTWSSAIQGVDAFTIEIEVNASGSGNENIVTVVGLPDTAVRESRERVWSALYTSGFTPPHGRTTINLAPADVRKEGAAFDLPIAVGMVAATNGCDRQRVREAMIVGELALDGSVRPVSNDVISLLFAADRMDHLDNEVLPLLQAGAEVVTDRYYHSSLTYQALQGDLDWIRHLNARALAPDITYILDLPAELAGGRRKRAGRAVEELYETDETQRLLQKAYLELPDLLPDESILVIDGRPDADSVHRMITGDLVARFGWG